MMTMQLKIESICQRAKKASIKLAVCGTREKNAAINKMADALLENTGTILLENAKDIENAKKNNMKKSMVDRLLLTVERIEDMAAGLREVAALPDCIGETMGGHVTQNGLNILKVRVPLGVIAIIYEARPNVTADAAGLAIKTGNAAVLRGGSDAIFSNKIITKVLSSALKEAGLPDNSVSLVDITDRESVDILLKMNSYLDVVIPRGGAGLIKKVVETSTVPVIETGIGICHTFIDESADFSMASDIVFNAKVSRPSVCNALETLLVHRSIADEFLPVILDRLKEAGVEFFATQEVKEIYNDVNLATEKNWKTEYGDLRMSVKIVEDIFQAMEHIRVFSSKHSEAIVTNDFKNGQLFQQTVDAAVVYVNASTRFTDGFEFGFGAEIGISTQKLHARGPMGLPELTSYKYIITGNGQIR